ncbi:hypothetical protein [Caldifermentibacillus hisashii]|uniref:hypothetical protein n=1 Tax=Caldifermentibacillus hisashii TaxID=996558 RepID=UPI003368D1E3
MVTRPLLVVIFMRETPFFGDETFSRRHFEPKNAYFWRRDHFSSSFLCGKLHFLVTRLFLVVIFWPETPFFGDETISRRHFWAEMPLFGDETLSRRHFCTGNSIFWRRDHFSSSLLREKLHFLATKPFLVVIFARKTPLFGDETLSRRHFCAKNSTFWR